MVQIYPEAFSPIHWGLNPRVTSNRSNGCQSFPAEIAWLRLAPTRAFFHDSLDVEKSTVQILSWTLEIYDLEFFAAHEGTEKPSGKVFNTLPSPTNITVVCDRRFPDEISSVDQHLFMVKVLNLPAYSLDLMVMRDHRSPDGTSSIDSILIILMLPSRVFQEDRSSSYSFIKALRLHIFFPGS
jgi:hypothetical protein